MKMTKCIACVVMAFFFYGCISHSEKMGEVGIYDYLPTGQIMMITIHIYDNNDKFLGYRLVSYTKDGTQIGDGIVRWEYDRPDKQLIETKNVAINYLPKEDVKAREETLVVTLSEKLEVLEQKKKDMQLGKHRVKPGGDSKNVKKFNKKIGRINKRIDNKS